MNREYIIKISDEIMEEEIADRPQELVRCKDCKFRGNINICPLAYIAKTEQFTALCVDEWFCGSGKRNEVK